MSHHPPKLPLRFFRWYCHPKLADYIEGDLLEDYGVRLKKSGKRKADIRFMVDVLLLFRPGIIKPTEGYKNLNNYGMVKSYFKIGWRNILKNRLFSLINVSGMAISMATFLIITFFIHDELQFDKHVEDYPLKYRVYNELWEENGSTYKGAMIPPIIAPTLAAQYPEVEYYLRFLNFNSPLLFEVEDKKFAEDKGGYADATIFDMFSLHLLEGKASTALLQPNAIAISRSLARKYFGDEPALGKTIIFNKGNLIVTAVFEDFSKHSHLQLNYVLAMNDFANGMPQLMNRWGWNQFLTYIKLKDGTSYSDFETKLNDFAQRNAWPETKPRDGSYYIPHLMPIDEIHLHAFDQKWDIAVRSNIQTVNILMATAAFILLIAILNFINLSTARGINRMKEVGVRKVMGAFRIQLIYQFISESVIMAFLALFVGILITQTFLPVVSIFTEKSLPTDLSLNPAILLALIMFAMLIGIAAGAYPAFFLSSYQPAAILHSTQSGKNLFRKGLVVLQFVLSFFLIIASFVVSDQHTYMRNAEMGFDKDNLIVLKLRGDMKKDLETTKLAFSNHPTILNSTLGYGLPGEAFAGDGIIDKVTDKQLPISMLTVDHDYVKTMGLTLIAGRDFSKDIPFDEKDAFIVSETAARLLGHVDPKEALEHGIAWNRWDAQDSVKRGKVIGVIKDLQLNSMRETITPVILQVYPYAYSSLTFHIKPDDIPATLAHLEKTWKIFNSEWPFEYKFLDENFDKMYKSEENLATLFRYFTLLTIFVACLGLFGLVVYSTSQKFREISIRKILGASEGTLIVQLGKNYLLLIAIAFVIAFPISFYAASEWLQKFAFHIPITPVLFIKAGSLIMIISLLTVGLLSLKAARANPVNALKEQ